MIGGIPLKKHQISRLLIKSGYNEPVIIGSARSVLLLERFCLNVEKRNPTDYV